MTTMTRNVAVLGATGKLGSALSRAIQADPALNLTRVARRAPENQEGSRFLSADVGDIDALEHVLTGQHAVICAIPGSDLPRIAENLVTVMDRLGIKRLIFTGAVGIYNEISAPDGIRHNVAHEPKQVPNRDAVGIVEASDLDYTILRPGFLRDGDADDVVLTPKGAPVARYHTTIPSVVGFVMNLLKDETTHLHESIAITRK
ncbi:NAD(P)H-binding [Actinomyces ruminicola]|uniref:NAD(P)H-binding n=1 Tax=Actinomyces ruminicola TaxID=332524 RepID=A0A1G9ZZW0_9ACTO|nr:NAD(P)H-binding protein [Actinomyces ruminicola]SDN26715.1 NAD(P)H-binding [Actinomyces ruminicola]